MHAFCDRSSGRANTLETQLLRYSVRLEIGRDYRVRMRRIGYGLRRSAETIESARPAEFHGEFDREGIPRRRY
jgi:hypothetical protein